MDATITLILTALKQTEHQLMCNATHDSEILANFCEQFSDNIKFFMEDEKRNAPQTVQAEKRTKI